MGVSLRAAGFSPRGAARAKARGSLHGSGYPGAPGPPKRRSGFTLLELIVVSAIISMLAVMLIVSLVAVRGSSRSFECKNKLKTVSFEFFQFASDYSHPNRGDSEIFGHAGFYINDFQERLYRIAEFWKGGSGAEAYKVQGQPMMCPAGPQFLQRRPGLPCDGNAVTPGENVSIALNMRLYKASAIVGVRPILRDVRLNSRILNHSAVPLAFDVDGAVANGRGVLPYYSAPPAGDTGRFGTGLFWFPSLRHGNQLNAAFIGGYVLSSRNPEHEAGWDWKYQPPAE